MADMVYLDNHASTAVDPRVLERMLPYFTDRIGNAASTSHAFGETAARAVETARGEVANAISSDPAEIVFTSGATESNNLAIKGVMRVAAPGSHIVVSAAEHRAVLDPVTRLRRDGCEVTMLPVDQHAYVTAESVADAIRPNTALVSVMHVNNEVGTTNPIGKIAAVCRQRGVLFHCDAAQSLGRIGLNVQASDVDLLSLSAHKAYGPQGVGALFVCRQHRARLQPLFHGGGHEAGLRSGTVPVPSVAGFGIAAKIGEQDRKYDQLRIRRLRDELWRRLREASGDLVLNGHPERRVAGNLNFSVPDVDGDVLLNEIEGIAVSSGSACSTGSREPSHVLLAMGRSSRLARASIRVGLGRFNTDEDIRIAASAIISAIEHARKKPGTAR